MINLFPHQQQALDETTGKHRVAYYLDMGLGKTFVGSEKMMKLGGRRRITEQGLSALEAACRWKFA